ncbi:MAG TPA: AraC family transcriptional regulator [Thermoanaerobaculia bacterium]|nr:AraC family transcriptional regulator [Thermoanaerobaculia bacterium]
MNARRGPRDPDPAGLTPLPFGTFNGEHRHAVAVRGFSLAEIVDRREQAIARHSHAHAHFCFILKGRYLTSARGVEGTCGPATMLFHPPGVTHGDRFHPDSRGGRFLAVSIAPETLALAGGHGGLIDHEAGFTAGELPALGIRIYRELRSRDEVSPLVIEGLALELLALAARETRRTGKGTPAWLANAYERIRDDFRARLTVRQLAESLDVDPLHLSRSFRKKFGCSPGDLLRQCRVRHAAELLGSRNARLAEVALDCGFADQAQLTRTFKRITGLTPGQYRKRIAS